MPSYVFGHYLNNNKKHSYLPISIHNESFVACKVTGHKSCEMYSQIGKFISKPLSGTIAICGDQFARHYLLFSIKYLIIIKFNFSITMAYISWFEHAKNMAVMKYPQITSVICTYILLK
jgi:hypothetical protein